MDGLLTAVKTVTRDSKSSLEPITESRNHPSEIKTQFDHDATSSDRILGVLKSKPDREQLFEILTILDPSNKDTTVSDFDIRVPSPISAQILQVFVNTTIPDHWDALNANSKGIKTRDAKARAALLRCLSSVAGLSCIVAQSRSLIAAARSTSQHIEGSSSHIQIQALLSVLSALLKPKDFALRQYTDIFMIYDNETQKQIAWRELVSLVAASRVLSTAAEALTLIKELNGLASILWVGEGSHYASWLGDNICHMVSKTEVDNQNGWKSAALLTGRALSLGYPDQLVRQICTGILIDQTLPEQFGSLLDNLRPTEQLAILEAIFRDVEKKHFSEELSGSSGENIANETINGVAALCSIVINDRPQLGGHVVDWLSKGQGGSIQTLGLRRAILATLSTHKDVLASLFTKSLEQFGDKFYIKHAPIRIQNANTQVVLLAAGYVHRLDATVVEEIGRSSLFLNSISNRLAASSARSRFLGMVVGMALSRLIEQPGKAMKFDLEEVESDEAIRYMNLTRTKDAIGSLESIKSEIKATGNVQRSKKCPKPVSTSHLRPRTNPQPVKVVSIEEINSSEDEEEEDLIPYEKPDADPSDSEDDPTLIQRGKPTAPVYIRDLITYLRDTDNVERYELGVVTAPSLIRRKIGFGTELIEHTEELALVLVGLQEKNKIPNFNELKLQSMVALIVSQPLKMGRWFSAMFFDGDISQSQRSSILTALGIGARELAGHGEEDAKSLGLPVMPDTSFPSKTLSANLEAMYLTDESPVAALTKKLSRASLQPLAASAADAVSGPNALKVRTFSSRMEVEKRRQQREAQRQKSTLKDLHRVLAEGFFYPLKGRFEIMMMQFSSSTAPSYNPFLIPQLLSLFLQTLTLILSTMGPHTPSLPALTQETLSLILSLHSSPVASEPTVLAALLSLFLAVIDLNMASGSSGEERLVTDFATQVIELREWAGEMFDRTPAVKGDDDVRNDPQELVRTLAAGVMVKLGEVMERYQGRLMGVSVGFKY